MMSSEEEKRSHCGSRGIETLHSYTLLYSHDGVI